MERKGGLAKKIPKGRKTRGSRALPTDGSTPEEREDLLKKQPERELDLGYLDWRE